MPKWGLTELQREAQPWGLPKKLLGPAKVITDPVHEDVYVTELERLIIDSPPMQRIRRVRQLGNSHIVYPAAGHSRFSHSIGTLRVAQDLLDSVWDNRLGPRRSPDLFGEWEEEGNLDGVFVARGPEQVAVPIVDACFAEATVLARIGALMHDLCHVPLGHTIEDELHVLIRHDENVPRFQQLWRELGQVGSIIDSKKSIVYPTGPTLKEELERLILSGIKRPEEAPPSSYPFVGDIVGNTICADLIDYLQRDHLFTGLPIALGNRFMDDFYLVPSQHLHFAKKMAVRITRNGRPRTDVVTELVKYLRYRYELTERVLTHHTKVAADAMVGKMLEMWSDATWVAVASDKYADIVAEAGRGNLDRLRTKITTADSRQLPKEAPDVKTVADRNLRRSKALADLDEAVRERLEAEFLAHSDDGLLEHLAGLSEPSSESRLKGVSALAKAVLNRDLFKLIGHAESPADMAVAKEKYAKFGSPEKRRAIELEASNFAELAHGWDAVVWLPDPDMKLKVAGVLVDNGEGIAPLARVSPEAEQIVAQHRQLWSISIYANLDIYESEMDRLFAQATLSRFRDLMDIHLIGWDGEIVPTTADLVVNRVVQVGGLDLEQARVLEGAVSAEMNSGYTMRTSVEALWRTAHANSFVTTDEVPAELWPVSRRA